MDAVRQALELTSQFIQIPSESSGQTLSDPAAPEAAMERSLLDFAERVGLHAFCLPVTKTRNNVIFELRGGGPKLLVVGHMDTVSAAGMDHPFDAKFSNGRIRGRGACDDKGPLAAALAVLAWMRVENIVPAFDITLAATVDEECTLAGAEKVAAWIDSFDLCIALEPTELRLVCAHKGDLRLRILTKGKAVHSSSPQKGLNAIDEMLPVIDVLHGYREKLAQQTAHPLCGEPTLSCTSLHAGSSSNIIPEDCVLTVDIRVHPGLHPADVYQELRNMLPDEVTIELLFAGKGVETDYNLPLIRELSTVIGAQGIDPTPIGVSYATDCCRLTSKGPCIVWGPGSISQAHQREEYIETEQIALAVGILQQFLCPK